jgi:hypothetical protein
MRRIPARGVAGVRGVPPRSLKCFLWPVPINGGGGCEALDLRLLPTCISGAGASPKPCGDPVTDIKFAAASSVFLLVERQYTVVLSVT